MANWNKLEVEKIERQDPAALVYRLSGILTDTHEAYEWLEDLRKAARRKDSPYIVINLEEVEHMPSSGVGILAACYTSVSNSGGRMCLAGVSDRVQSILELVGIWDILTHFPTEAAALAEAAQA
jgi:anti-anti-sigma factor